MFLRMHDIAVLPRFRIRARRCALLLALACGVDRVELGEPLGTAGAGAAATDEGGTDNGGTPDAVPGCSKIDFLFVIDNSLSMAFAQENLKASFSSLLGVLDTTLAATDFHIMVVDTDAGGEGDDSCDLLGSGRRNNGQDGSDCGLPAGLRYTAPSPDLESAFECMATVGTFGEAREQQAGALLSAVGNLANDAGGCNAGFSRPDAVLVVTLVTNTDDAASMGEPDAWYDALVQLKGGNEASVVMLGFLPGDAFADPSSGLLCNLVSGFTPAPRLDALITRFSHHQVGSVCADDYGPLFASAVDSIGRACDEFTAPVR